MQENDAVDFYERIVQGKDYTETISLEHSSGDVLEGIEMHPVDKQTLAGVIQRLPDDMFDALEEADDPDEAEDMIEENENVSLSVMSEDTVEGFEILLKESLVHPDLTKTQMRSIVEELDFSVLFELGGEIIDMSFSRGAAIKDFREQQ